MVDSLLLPKAALLSTYQLLKPLSPKLLTPPSVNLVTLLRCLKYEQVGLSGVLENAGTGNCRYWKMPVLENASTEKCRYWKMPVLKMPVLEIAGTENAGTEKCRNWKMPVLENAGTGN